MGISPIRTSRFFLGVFFFSLQTTPQIPPKITLYRRDFCFCMEIVQKNRKTIFLRLHGIDTRARIFAV
jgi:hypothetical protein